MSTSKIQVLVVEDEELIREMMAVMIGERYDVEIHEASGGNQAVDIMKEHKIDLVISDLNMPDGNGDVIYTYNKDHDKTPFLFITSVDVHRHPNLEDYFQQPDHFYLPKPFTDDQVYAICDKVFINKDTDKQAPLPNEEGEISYASIPIQVGHHLTEEIGEIFIKINNEKYLKYLDKFEHGDLEKFEKLSEKGCTEIFVHNYKYEEWITARLKIIKENLKKAEGSPNSSKEAVGSVLQLSRVVFNVGDFPSSLVGQFEEQIEGIIDNLWKTKDTKATIKEQLAEKGLIQTHSSVCLFLCNILNKKINMNDQAKYKKLALASLFHDITLTDDNLAKIYTHEQAVTHIEDENARETLLLHPDQSAERLKPIPSFDLDTLDIIKNHHELPHGQGFPRKSDLKKLKLLCRQFNVVHHMSYIISQSGDFTKGDYFTVRDIFDDDEFLKYIDVIYDYFNAET